MLKTEFDSELFSVEGISSPARLFDNSEVDELYSQYRAYRQMMNEHVEHNVLVKPHLLCNWLDDIVRHPAIVDRVESVLGPHIVLWESDFNINVARIRGRRALNLARQQSEEAEVRSDRPLESLNFHQDLPFWNLSNRKVVNVVLAITPLTHQSGALRVVPGSHLDLYAGDAPAKSLCIELAPGEFCLHHGNLVHASSPNLTRNDSITFVMRYISADVFSYTGIDSVTYIKGEMLHDQFVYEPRVDVDFDASALSALERAMTYPSGLGQAEPMQTQ